MRIILWPSVRTLHPSPSFFSAPFYWYLKLKLHGFRNSNRQTLESPKIELGTLNSEGRALTNWPTPFFVLTQGLTKCYSYSVRFPSWRKDWEKRHGVAVNWARNSPSRSVGGGIGVLKGMGMGWGDPLDARKYFIFPRAPRIAPFKVFPPFCKSFKHARNHSLYVLRDSREVVSILERLSTAYTWNRKRQE